MAYAEKKSVSVAKSKADIEELKKKAGAGEEFWTSAKEPDDEEIEDVIRQEDAPIYYMNDGWIPVEQKLPERDGFYIATMDGEIVGQEEPFVGLAEFENGLWVDDDIDYKCIIAWQSLPEPYRPERSEEE